MEVGAKTIQSTLAAVNMLKYLTHKLRTQSINDEHPVNNEKVSVSKEENPTAARPFPNPGKLIKLVKVRSPFLFFSLSNQKKNLA